MIDRDPGLAAERTSLAWQRTGIAIIAAGLAEIRGLPHRTELSGRPLIGLAIAGFGIFSFVVSSRQAARRKGPASEKRRTATISDLWPLAASSMFVALGALVIAALHG